MSSFTQRVWQEVAPIRQAMLTMPFNAELCDGSLSRERFHFYLLQDSVYLTAYARTLALAAARAPDPELIFEYTKRAEVAIVVERALHEGFLKDFGLTRDERTSHSAADTWQSSRAAATSGHMTAKGLLLLRFCNIRALHFSLL